MIGDTYTSALAISLALFFLIQSMNLKHYPRTCWVGDYILKPDLPSSSHTLSLIIFADLRIIPDYSDAKKWE